MYNLFNLTVNTTVPRLSTDECDIVKKSLTQAMIVDRYPSDIWSHMYTDCSASAAIKEGSAGIFLFNILQEIQRQLVNQQASTVHTTELRPKQFNRLYKLLRNHLSVAPRWSF